MSEIKISASRIKTLQNCSFLYKCIYVDKLPQSVGMAAHRGTLCHLIFELLLKPRHRKYVETLSKNVENIKSHPSISRLIKKNAKKFGVSDEVDLQLIYEMVYTGLQHDFLVEGAREIVVEHEFKIPVGKNVIINGFIDKLAIFDKEIKVVDFKTSAKKFTKDEIDSNVQDLMYSLAVYKERGIIPQVSFIFLRFPENPIQTSPPCTEKELRGFEIYLEKLADYLSKFTEAHAKSDYAANDAKRKWLCGFCKAPGELKKDGNKKWHCQYRFPFHYWALKKENRVVKTSFNDDLKPDVAKGEKVTKEYFQGCPRWNRVIDIPDF